MISRDTVEEISERLSILDVVSDYMPLRRSGANYVGLCPFHGEKSPSFNVNPAREIFHCFGCGAGGDMFSFVMRMEGVAFPDALRMLASKAGITIRERETTPSERRAADEESRMRSALKSAAEYYRTSLQKGAEGEKAREYLARRGVTHEISDAYQIGYAPETRDGLTRHLRAAGIDLDLATDLGIIRKGDSGGYYDLLRNRLIFPIRDQKGNPIGFAGRVLDASLPKYINSPESRLYRKSSVLFGLDMALNSIRTEQSVIIVEGYFDHLALYRAGFRNVVATCGTALTSAHASIIKRHAKRACTLFDSDAAGEKATFRAMEIFLEQGMPCSVISLPKGDDPDSFLQSRKPEDFRERISAAIPAFEFFIRTTVSRGAISTVDGKSRAADLIVPVFRKISDPLEKDLYEREICRLLDIQPHVFRKRISVTAQAREKGQKLTEPPANISPEPSPETDSTQEMLLSLIIVYPEALSRVRETGTEAVFEGQYRTVADIIMSSRRTEDSPGAVPSDIREVPELQMIYSKAVMSASRIEEVDWKKAFAQCISKRERSATKKLKEMASRLAVVETDSEEYSSILSAANELRMKKSQLHALTTIPR